MKPEGNEIGWRMTVVADGGGWSVTVEAEVEAEEEAEEEEEEEGWRAQELKEGAREGGGGWLEGEGG